jgi:chromosome segregation ATPase
VVGDWSGRVSLWNTADAKPVGDLSAAPPSIDQRLASLRPELEKTTQAVAAAKASLGQTSARMSTARKQLEQAQHVVAVFQQKSSSVDQALARARTAAEALLTRLQAPAPAPGPTPPAMDLGTARVLAEDLKALTATAKAALGPMGSSVTEAGREFESTVPGQLSAQLTLAKTKEAELAEGEKRAAEEQKAVEQAAAALAERQKEAARWEAAKLNARIFEQRNQLAALTTRIEELTEDVAARDKTLAETPARLAGAPDADKPALEKALADARSGLDGLRAELDKAKTEADALRSSIGKENERYLSMLPK